MCSRLVWCFIAAIACKCRPVTGLWLAALLCLLPATSTWAQSMQTNTIAIHTVVLQNLAKPDQSSVLALPVQIYRDERALSIFRATGQFELQRVDTEHRWALYFLSLHEGGRIWINGHEVGDVATSNASTSVRHVRPYSEHLLLGNNVLQIEWGSRETLLSVPRIFIGHANDVLPHYERRLFWQNTMAQVSFVFALVVAAMMLGVYAQQRDKHLYLLIGLSELGWAVLNVGYFLPPIPAPLFVAWRFFFYSMIGLFAVCGWLFVYFESGLKKRWYPTLCIAWGALGPLAYVLASWSTGASYFKWVEGYWALGCALMGVFPLAALVRRYALERKPRHLVYLLAATAVLVVAVSDSVAFSGKDSFGSVGYSLQVVAPVWFMAVCAVLITDFVRSLRAQQEQRALMDTRLHQQEQELHLLHEKDRAFERSRATALERERIMQDMHDGLGSQLVSSLALTEKGEVTAQQTSALLRACIDDLRLAIDASGEDGLDLAVAVGNLRFRMAPRLRAAGIALHWDAQHLQADVAVQHADILPILRILQECITNTLKHAHASSLHISIRSDAQSLQLSIQDNGCGFDSAVASNGKGLSGMHKRARKMGAALSVRSSAQGTVVQCILAIVPPKLGTS
jgi:signal transduction histidine kinase